MISLLGNHTMLLLLTHVAFPNAIVQLLWFSAPIFVQSALSLKNVVRRELFIELKQAVEKLNGIT